MGYHPDSDKDMPNSVDDKSGHNSSDKSDDHSDEDRMPKSIIPAIIPTMIQKTILNHAHIIIFPHQKILAGNVRLHQHQHQI